LDENLVESEPPDGCSIGERDRLSLEELSPAGQLESTPADDEVSDIGLERLEGVVSVGVGFPIGGVKEKTLEGGDDLDDGAVEVHREDSLASVVEMSKNHLLWPFLREGFESSNESTDKVNRLPHLVWVGVRVEVVGSSVGVGS